MLLLFTRSNKLGSKIIRKVTGENISHVSILKHNIVYHASFTGIKKEKREDFFLRGNKVVYVLHAPTTDRDIDSYYIKNRFKMYDFGAFIFLGLRILFPKLINKRNLWQTTGMFLCTEFVSDYLFKKEDSLITPEKLYFSLLINQKEEEGE